MNFLTELKNDLAAIRVLKDWLGDGGEPVPTEKAESRAAICQPCLKNHQQDDWWSWAKGVLADAIRSHMSLKKRLNIRPKSLDSQLGTCTICSCQQKLKVHVPVEHIHKHTEEKMVKEFPPECWVRIELESL